MSDPTASRPRARFARGVEWRIVVFLGAIHALAIALCVAFPSWQGALLCVALYFVTGLGVTIGYHRKITHHAFRSPKWVEYVLAVLGLLAGEGPPVFWAAIQRQHHRFSDRPGDPHSPAEGFWWAHWLWLTPKLQPLELGALYRTFAPDLIRDPFYRALERLYLVVHAAFAVFLVAAGWAIDSWRMGMSFLAYGYFLRMVIVLHGTWMVNSVAHRWGYRTYDTEDGSRNNPLVALIAHGEGWHNNHHRVQAAANHGHRWWELDLSFWAIVLAGVVTRPIGLITDIRVYSYRSDLVTTWLKSSGSGPSGPAESRADRRASVSSR